MKILLANYRYFISGGPERYLFNVSTALEERGHSVIPFSIRYEKNIPTPFSKYFVSPIGDENEVYFKEQKKNIKTLWKTTKRLFYDKEVEYSVNNIVESTKPDIAYVLHYLRKLSPALLVGLKKAGIPIVVRLSDYAMICPQALFLRKNKACELCLERGLFCSLRYKCVQNSYIASLLNLAATKFHYYKKFFDLIDAFVVTNEFMFSKMLDAGYSSKRIIKIPTFVDLRNNIDSSNCKQNDLIVFVGRIEEIKGVHILISAISIVRSRKPNLSIHLKIIGSGDEGYFTRLKKMVLDLQLESNVEFLGNKDLGDISKFLSLAIVSVIPSICYENLPNVVLESYACGTAVIASSIGSIPFDVREKVNGYLFNPGDPVDLAEKLEYCLLHTNEMEMIGRHNRIVAGNDYSKSNHLNSLETLFENILSKPRTN